MNRLAVQAASLARTPLRDVDRALKLAARFRDGLALFARQKLSDSFLLIFHQAGCACDDAASGRRGRPSPFTKSLARSLDRRTRLFARCLTKAAEHVVGVGRIDILDGFGRG